MTVQELLKELMNHPPTCRVYLELWPISMPMYGELTSVDEKEDRVILSTDEIPHHTD